MDGKIVIEVFRVDTIVLREYLSKNEVFDRIVMFKSWIMEIEKEWLWEF